MSESSTINFTNIFLLKGGNGAPPDNTLQEKELGWDMENKELYIGVKENNIVKSHKVLSSDEFLPISGGEITNDLIIGNNLTVNQNLIVKSKLSCEGDVTGKIFGLGGADKTIESGDDFNDYIEIDTYNVRDVAAMSQILNAPCDQTGVLRVLSADGKKGNENTSRLQVFLTDDGITYTRLATYSNNVWNFGNWKQKTVDIADFQNRLQTEIVNIVYPVGSIYMSVSASVSPETLLGVGKWERIEDRFLLAAGSTYQAGSQGGSSTVTLSVEQIASHTHTFEGTEVTTSSDTHNHTVPNTAGNNSGSGVKAESWNSASASGRILTTEDDIHNHTVTAEGTNSKTGGGQPHENMPPYLAVYIWKRTA